jgi:hypothetical protein
MKKYYTPSIEEFHVGFEYEYNSDLSNLMLENTFGKWEKEIFTASSNSMMDESEIHDIELGLDPSTESIEIRVKYLDREDIEREGFEFEFVRGTKLMFGEPVYEHLSITYDSESNHLTIGNKDVEDDCDYYLFQGKVKNKSELKRILKQIGYEQ